MKPTVYDLYCGLGGWSEGFLAEGYDCIGFDVEAHDYGTGGYPGKLILRDVRSIHGSEMKDAAVIVASPPCQAYSYRAMPWSRAKALPPPDNTLFNECFRIQREASEAAGHYIPLIVENVRGAQKWVGRAQWHYGSFYLWGDVPALMPMTFKASKVSGFRFDGESHGSFQSEAVKATRCTCPTGCDCQNPEPADGGIALVSEECPIHNWNERPSPTCPVHGEHLAAGIKAGDRNINGKWTSSFADSLKTVGHANILDGHTRARHLTNQRESDAVKHDGSRWTEKGSLASHNRLVSNQPQEGYKTAGMNWSNRSLRGQDFTRIAGAQGVKCGNDWFGSGENCSLQRRQSSKSTPRKAASAMIAKIPFELSSYLARHFKPEVFEVEAVAEALKAMVRP